jgi:UDP-N-acetylglucosamine 2-epimerase (non-hydrolysing)
VTGNTIVDSIQVGLELAKKAKRKLPKGRFALVSIHRQENIRSRVRLKAVVDTVQNIPIPVYFPLHQNTLRQLKRFGLLDVLKKRSVHLIEPLAYPDFLSHLRSAVFVVTDGGSIQEESLILGIPCIVMRKSTERTEGIARGMQVLTGCDATEAKDAIAKILDGRVKTAVYHGEYGKVGVSRRIVDLLLERPR